MKRTVSETILHKLKNGINTVHEVIKRREAEERLRQAEVEESLKREELMQSSFNLSSSTSSNRKRKSRSAPPPVGTITRPIEYMPTHAEVASDLSNTSAPPGGIVETTMNICNTFWRPSLTFNPYKHGDPLVDFGSLWPEEEMVEMLMMEAYQATALRRSVLEICKTILRCGPLRVLKVMLNLQIINIDQVFEDGSGMLHLACIAHNLDAALFLCSSGINPEMQDKYGRTADQICFCPQIRKLLPARYLLRDAQRTLKTASMQDKDTIFSLAKSVKSFNELQVKLQTLQFDVNKETDDCGDYLIHAVTKEGLAQLPLLMALTKIQKADIEIHNNQGLTPLMLAADMGNTVLVDVLLCVVGANPNTPNPINGRTALHYAAKENHMEAVSVLVKRGGDINMEDSDGRRPDDVAFIHDASDCREVICANRVQRVERLSELAEKGTLAPNELRVTDLYTVDHCGCTLIMTAALFNRYENVTVLVEREGAPIDAQHEKTGQTALSLASAKGHEEAIDVLMRNGANPAIRDINGLMPMHYTIKNGHQVALCVLLQYPQAFVGLQKALKLAETAEMQRKVRDVIARRQAEIVTPELFECAVTGNAQKLYCVLEEGDNVNPVSGVGDWPMYLAAENGHLDVMKLLVEQGGDIMRQHRSTKNTILHLASVRGYCEIVKYLLKFCHNSMTKRPAKDSSTEQQYLSINAINKQRKTALQLAAEKGHSRVVRMLLHGGATSALLDAEGRLFNCAEFEGVQVLIENNRKERIKLLTKCIKEKRSVTLSTFRKIWQAPFDHNLRTVSRDTPLMLACLHSRADLLPMMLMSAIYEIDSVDADNSLSKLDSDADSGTFLETSAVKHINQIISENDDYQCCSSDSDQPFSPIQTMYRSLFGKPRRKLYSRKARSSAKSGAWRANFLGRSDLSPEKRQTDVDVTEAVEEEEISDHSQMEEEVLSSNRFEDASLENALPPASGFDSMSLLMGASRPRGSLYTSENQINHLCAINPKDGATAFHRTVEGGDNVAIMNMLLKVDHSAVNVQDEQGTSPLHLACQLGRKKVVKLLTSMEYVDLNCRTLDGKLAEEMTNSKSLTKLVQAARQKQPYNAPSPAGSLIDSHSYNGNGSFYSNMAAGSQAGSSIDFEKINTRFVMMKRKMETREVKDSS